MNESARRRPARRQHRAHRRTMGPLPERHPRLAYVFAILPVLLIGSLLLSGPFVYRVNTKLDKIFQPTPVVSASTDPRDPAATPIPLPDWNKKERVNILLVGIDKRADDDYSRTDTMILVSIDPASKTVGMLSLPRDLKVSIPGYPDDKLNAAFVFGEVDRRAGGGIGLLQRTIQQNFGVAVPYYGEVDFQGFEKIVDTFGGVNVDPPYPLKDDEYPTEWNGYVGIYFPAGWQHLNGHEALQYARTRHPDSDFGRSSRQQEVLLALRQQALNRSLPSKFFTLVDILSDSVKTNLSKEQAAALVNLAQQIPRENIKRYSIQDLVQDRTEPDTSGQSIYYLYADWPKVRQRIREMVPNAAMPLAMPTPDLRAKIGVRNGTVRDRFAARTVDRLQAAGFTGAVVDTRVPDGVPLAQTIVYDYSTNSSTAIQVAKALGLSVDAVREGAGSAPDGVDILIVLGNDVSDAPVTPVKPTATPTKRLGQ